MKRVGFIYEKVISLDNLRKADKKAQKGKSKHRGVIAHNKNREQNILSLHKALQDGTYKTTEYSVFIIREPKERVISSLSFYPNLIVHRAIMLVIENRLVDSFISQTYSCIKGRGIHKCSYDLAKGLKDVENSKYCLKMDVKKFYPSINKNILKIKLRGVFKDERFLDLLFEIINSNEKGLPLGNLLSQWLANLYLNSFDHYVKEVLKLKYYRYCDDMVFLHSSKHELHNIRRHLQEYLRQHLDLSLSNYQVFPVESRGINYVGYVRFHKYVLLRKSIKTRYKKMIKCNNNSRSITSYNGWLSHANCKHLKTKYEKII